MLTRKAREIALQVLETNGKLPNSRAALRALVQQALRTRKWLLPSPTQQEITDALAAYVTMGCTI